MVESVGGSRRDSSSSTSFFSRSPRGGWPQKSLLTHFWQAPPPRPPRGGQGGRQGTKGRKEGGWQWIIFFFPFWRVRVVFILFLMPPFHSFISFLFYKTTSSLSTWIRPLISIPSMAVRPSSSSTGLWGWRGTEERRHSTSGVSVRLEQLFR